MTPDRYRRASEAFEQICERPAEVRQELLKQLCAEEDLYRDVEALLLADEQSTQFLTSQPHDIAAAVLAGRQLRSLIGQRLGDYQVLSRLGTGGMGEVFLAQDTRLGRKAALKFLPEEYTLDSRRLQRFAQEAAAISALNHPNIVTIYGFGQAGAIHFIATEFVEGQTLRERIAGGPLTLESTVEIALQVTSALTAAHAAGIVHRDIKPENILVRSDGLVKVLDFGIAKQAGSPETPSEQECGSESDTLPGLVVGTPRYMAPEQACGLPVDARADLFSLGSVLYEMLAGSPAMSGKTPSDILSSVTTRDPLPLKSVRRKCPTALIRFMNRALERDRDKRFQSAEEMAADLRRLQSRLKPGLTRLLGPRRITLALSVAAIAIILTAVLLLRRDRSSGGAIDSIAVLPFANEGSGELNFLADGLTDSLIGDLSQVPNLKVISRSSVSRYKGRQVDPALTGSLLRARSVLTGRVSQRGDRLLVHLELVDVRDNHRLWGEEYNRVRGDLLQTQIDISREVLEKLRIRLTQNARRQLSQRHKATPEAFELYLKGRSFLFGGTKADLDNAIVYFQRALNKDPSYALASVGLANAYVGLSDYISPKEAMPRAREYALTAIELSGGLPEAHVALGLVKLLYDWDWRGAEREFKGSLDPNPNSVEVFSCYLHYQDTLGRTDEAVAGLAELLAHDPSSAWENQELGCVSYYARRYDAAIKQFQRTIRLNPEFQLAYANAGRAFAQKRMYREAIDALEKGRKIDPDWPMTVAELAYAHAASGDKVAARKLIQDLKRTAQSRYVDPFLLAVAYLGLGNRHETFRYLEKAYTERSSSMPWIKVEPRFDSLRSDPEYLDLLRRVGFT